MPQGPCCRPRSQLSKCVRQGMRAAASACAASLEGIRACQCMPLTVFVPGKCPGACPGYHASSSDCAAPKGAAGCSPRPPDAVAPPPTHPLHTRMCLLPSQVDSRQPEPPPHWHPLHCPNWHPLSLVYLPYTPPKCLVVCFYIWLFISIISNPSCAQPPPPPTPTSKFLFLFFSAHLSPTPTCTGVPALRLQVRLPPDPGRGPPALPRCLQHALARLQHPVRGRRPALLALHRRSEHRLRERGRIRGGGHRGGTPVPAFRPPCFFFFLFLSFFFRWSAGGIRMPRGFVGAPGPRGAMHAACWVTAWLVTAAAAAAGGRVWGGGACCKVPGRGCANTRVELPGPAGSQLRALRSGKSEIWEI